MKKLLSFSAILIAMVCFVQTAQAQTPVQFNLSMTVDKYIETVTSPINVNLGTTLHSSNAEGLNTAVPQGSGWLQGNLAYANCLFSVTISGDNPVGQLVPRFARAQDGAHANGVFDILSTGYQIGIYANGVDVTAGAWGMNYGITAGSFPRTVSATEIPHNGQVSFKLASKVNAAGGGDELSTYPIRQTLINPAFTDQQSADAGIYTCTMVITLAAL